VQILINIIFFAIVGILIVDQVIADKRLKALEKKTRHIPDEL